ncbi:Protein CBG14045 [Caenorhabditis briggsae]|uniref:Protein CBG14045 n=1 Tax=Caenorhabditis briggsae TaxID=6238 RepID=A8XJ87_CAEBR|nr:Protein CBG14045 [Caenorhabditis briggsae]CAP32712.1 Protein CBG14045 [Caenorhabditis briggsae]
MVPVTCFGRMQIRCCLIVIMDQRGSPICVYSQANFEAPPILVHIKVRLKIRIFINYVFPMTEIPDLFISSSHFDRQNVKTFASRNRHLWPIELCHRFVCFREKFYRSSILQSFYKKASLQFSNHSTRGQEGKKATRRCQSTSDIFNLNRMRTNMMIMEVFWHIGTTVVIERMLSHYYWDQVRNAPTNVPVQNQPANEPSTSETGPSDPLFPENNPFFTISKSLLTMNNAKIKMPEIDPALIQILLNLFRVLDS